jgi:hypothetical protein
MINAHPKCAHCRYLGPEHAGVPGIYECRRFPPRTDVHLLQAGRHLEMTFNFVNPDWWCGEYKTKLEGLS